MKTVVAILSLGLVCAPAAFGQEWARARWEKSPRHRELVSIRTPDRAVDCFLVYPEVKDRAGTVVVIHEIFGLTDWVKSLADQLAEAGYIAIAPDLLSGRGPRGGGTESFPDAASVMAAIRDLSPGEVAADLNAAADYAAARPSANGRVAAAGFCWGGSQAFLLAARRPSLSAACVFYGSGPESEETIGKISCPIYGFYGGNDARVTATVPATAEMMKKAGKLYEPVVYEGAGHGFMRAGEDPGDAGAANRQARDEAWIRWRRILKEKIGSREDGVNLSTGRADPSGGPERSAATIGEKAAR